MENNQPKPVRTIIIFSPANLDSCMASAVTAAIHKHEGHDHAVEFIPYVRSNDTNTLDSSIETCKIHVLGADLLPTDMSTLLTNYPFSTFNIESYQNSTVYNDKIKSILETKGSYQKYQRESFDEGINREPSIGLKQSCFNDPDKAEGFDLASIRELANVVSKYCQFKPMTAEETLFLFVNIKGIRKAARGDCELKVLRPTEVTQADYTDYVQEVRQLVTSNNAMTYYAGANGTSFITPTICVGDRDAMHAMRFINYSYDEVISFEDTRTCRIYRIYSEKNLQWYIKRFEPMDIWTEGFVTYLKTELPKHVR